MYRLLVNKLGITYQRGNRFKTLLGLLWNAVLLFKWRISKQLRGIHVPVVHYYAVCWNEEKMLPFMFHHYESIVDKFFVFDNDGIEHSGSPGAYCAESALWLKNLV